MSRDSTGNYTSPTGPFVAGTTINSNVMNQKLEDLGDEITASLSRNGDGAMLSPLRVPDGTINLPGYAFSSETTLGFHRAGTTDLRVVKDGTNIFKFNTTENRSYSALKAALGITVDSGGLTVTAGGLTVTAGGGTISAGGLNVTGTLPAQGGVAPASRFATTGAISTTINHSHAMLGLTDFEAGATNNPVRLNVRTENSVAVDEWQDVRVGLSYDEANSAYGIGGKVMISPREGVLVTGGTAATGADPANALTLTNGNLKLSGTAPNSDEALANTLTPSNLLKVVAHVRVSAANTAVIDSGQNVTSAAITPGSDTLVITFAADFADTTYGVTTGSNYIPIIQNKTSSTIAIQFFAPGSGTAVDLDGGGGPFVTIHCTGAQA